MNKFKNYKQNILMKISILKNKSMSFKMKINN